MREMSSAMKANTTGEWRHREPAHSKARAGGGRNSRSWRIGIGEAGLVQAKKRHRYNSLLKSDA